MPVTPFHIVWIWLRGLVAIAIIVGAVSLLRNWYDDAHVWVPDPPAVVANAPREPARSEGDRATAVATTGHREFRFTPGWDRLTAMLAGGLALATIAVAGRFLMKGLGVLTLKAGSDEPNRERGGEVHRIRRPDGTELNVECYGPADAPPIVFTHGWGADATEWYYVKKHLAGRFRLIAWDLPGLGKSRKPDDNNYSLDKLAADLDAVIDLAGGRPVVLVGHSIGGMILLTYARDFAEALGSRVAGLALVHTTYTDPIHTMKNASIKTALEKPLVVPLLHLTIGLWPLVWAMNWLAYCNGSFHKATRKDSFAGTETRGEVDFAAGFLPRARPDVLARGMFGMMHYDVSATLPTIALPTLVVEGDKDVTCLPEASQRIAADAPGATLRTLSPARHMGLIEHHDEFNRLVAEFAGACLGTVPAR